MNSFFRYASTIVKRLNLLIALLVFEIYWFGVVVLMMLSFTVEVEEPGGSVVECLT